MITLPEAASIATIVRDVAPPVGAATEQWGDSFLLHNMWELGPIKTVLGLKHLPVGWDNYGSPAPSGATIEAAVLFVREIAGLGLEGLHPPNIVPLAGGGIQLEWHIGNRELEIPIFPDRHVEFLTVQDGEPQLEGELTTYRQMRVLLSWLVAGAG